MSLLGILLPARSLLDRYAPPLFNWPRSTGRLLMRQHFHLAQHFLHPAADVLAILAQLHQFAAHGFIFFLALLELLAQPLGIALGSGSRFFWWPLPPPRA